MWFNQDRIILRLLFAALIPISCGPSSLSDSAAVADDTNVILIIVDDLGWKDLSITGSELYLTPRIDALAEKGVRFDHFYSDSPVCSPTRAALMTGKHPARLHITNWIGGEQKGQLLQADYEYQLPLEEITVAERFLEAGYETGYIGKWHLGGSGFYPENQGFNTNIAGHHAGQPASYFYPYKREGGSAWDVPGLEGGQPGEYLTDRLTDEAIQFIDKNSGDPFFLVLSHYAVHTPIQAKEEMTEAAEKRLATNPTCSTEAFENDPKWSSTRVCQDNAAYAAMVESTDESIGRILDTLDELQLAERTAIIFVSDNGGLSSLTAGNESAPTSNRPLRAGKGYLYEGGVRIPMIIYDPNSSRPGVRSLAASTIDITPTLLDLAGIDIIDLKGDDPAISLDGRSLLSEAQEEGELNERALFSHFPHYHGSGNRPSGSVRAGDYKLLEWFETGDLELYDLSADPGEQHNLSPSRPALRDSLFQIMSQWRQSVDANMPTPNPDWNKE